MFYGTAVCVNDTVCDDEKDHLINSFNRTVWETLNKIDVEDFLRNTRPSYSLFMCDIQGHECKTRWRRRRNYWGNCLEFTSAWYFGKHPIMSTNTRLSFTFSWLESDFTYGLNGQGGVYMQVNFAFM